MGVSTIFTTTAGFPEALLAQTHCLAKIVITVEINHWIESNLTLVQIGAFAARSTLSQPKWISVVIFATPRKSATEKRDLKKHISLSVAICDRKPAERIPRPKVGVSLA